MKLRKAIAYAYATSSFAEKLGHAKTEFEGIKIGAYGLPLERDRHYSGTLADAMKAAGYEYGVAA